MFGRCHLPGELGCGIMGTFPSLLHVRKRKRPEHDQSLMAAERSWASRWCRAGSEPLDEVLVRDVEETQRPPIARYFAEEGNASPASPRLQRATQLELLRLCSKAPHSATREANLAALAASRQRLLQADGEDLGQEDELADELRAFCARHALWPHGTETLVLRHFRVGGRGLAAAADLSAGDTVLAVPESLLLSSERQRRGNSSALRPMPGCEALPATRQALVVRRPRRRLVCRRRRLAPRRRAAQPRAAARDCARSGGRVGRVLPLPARAAAECAALGLAPAAEAGAHPARRPGDCGARGAARGARSPPASRTAGTLE